MNKNMKFITEFSDDDFTAPHQFELYNYWLKLKQGSNLPARSDIDIIKLKHMLPSLMLFDYESDSEALIFRLIGTACVAIYGEKTGKDIGSFQELSNGEKRLLWSVYNKKPYYGVKKLSNIDKDYLHNSFIVLPLSDDGETVNKLLVSHHFY